MFNKDKDKTDHIILNEKKKGNGPRTWMEQPKDYMKKLIDISKANNQDIKEIEGQTGLYQSEIIDHAITEYIEKYKLSKKLSN